MDRDLHLHYGFEAGAQTGAALHNPLFELLQAVHDHGSIRHAAEANGVSYRYVWGQLKRWEQQLGAPLVHWTQGQPARLTAQAERLLWAERRARARFAPQIDALRAELARVLTDALDGSGQSLPLAGEYEPALVALRELAGRAAQGTHVELHSATPDDALRALEDGRALLAAVTLPADPARLPALTADRCRRLATTAPSLIGGWQRAAGLMVAPGNPYRVEAVTDLLKPGLRLVQREPGSAARTLLDRLLDDQRVDAGRVHGHGDAPEPSTEAVAVAVASGRADAGLGCAAVAAAHGLDFVPLLDEVCVLACQPRALDHPAVLRLLEALRSPAWAEALVAVRGCQPWRAGEVIEAPQGWLSDAAG